ncbi:hypothetical protein D3C73_1644060 [compost metagenome]
MINTTRSISGMISSTWWVVMSKARPSLQKLRSSVSMARLAPMSRPLAGSSKISASG